MKNALEPPTDSGLDNIVALLRYHTLEQPTDSGLDNIRYQSHYVLLRPKHNESHDCHH